VARVSAKSDSDGSLVKLGAAIIAARKAQRMSQESLADVANIERAHVGRIERGERNLTFLTLLRVAAALKLKPSDLLERSGL